MAITRAFILIQGTLIDTLRIKLNILDILNFILELGTEDIVLG